MKVSELIEKLKECDPNMDVVMGKECKPFTEVTPTTVEYPDSSEEWGAGWVEAVYQLI